MGHEIKVPCPSPVPCLSPFRVQSSNRVGNRNGDYDDDQEAKHTPSHDPRQKFFHVHFKYLVKLKEMTSNTI